MYYVKSTEYMAGANTGEGQNFTGSTELGNDETYTGMEP